MKRITIATPLLACFLLLLCNATYAETGSGQSEVTLPAEESQDSGQAGVASCIPISVDLTPPADREILEGAIFSPAAETQVLEDGDHGKVSTRRFTVELADGTLVERLVSCKAHCPSGEEPLGCTPRPNGTCGFCGCTGGGPCVCNRLVLE